MKIIEEKDLATFSSFFKGENKHRRAEIFMRMFSIDKVNQAYDNSCGFTGAGFAANLLNELGARYVIGNPENLKLLPEGAFITIANHPYGGLDGIILIDLMARIRPDYKLMVNKVLSMVKVLKENFISVTPAGNKKIGITGTSINGVRETMNRLRNGHPVGFFPSGAVSDFSLSELRIRDRKWQPGILHLIHSARVPILPIRFFDINSPFFYFLGLINWKIRSLRMPHELFNKKKKEMRVGIGSLISVNEQQKFPDFEKLGSYLRKCVYEMPVPSSFLPGNRLNYPEKRPVEVSLDPHYQSEQHYSGNGA